MDRPVIRPVHSALFSATLSAQTSANDRPVSKVRSLVEVHFSAQNFPTTANREPTIRSSTWTSFCERTSRIHPVSFSVPTSVVLGPVLTLRPVPVLMPVKSETGTCRSSKSREPQRKQLLVIILNRYKIKSTASLTRP